MPRWITIRWMMCAAAVCLALAGCVDQITPQAQQQLDAGRSAYMSGDDAKTIRTLNEFLAANSRSKEVDLAFYFRALAKFRTNDTAGARADFIEVINRTGRSDLKGLSLKGLGDIAFDAGDMALAEASYRQALGQLDHTRKPIDEIRFRMGVAMQRLSRWNEADLQFARLMEQFKDSPLAARAQRLVHATAWTVQAGAFDERSRALAQVNRLSAAGIPSGIVVFVQTPSGPKFAAQAGRLDSYAEAAALAGKCWAMGISAEPVVTK